MIQRTITLLLLMTSTIACSESATEAGTDAPDEKEAQGKTENAPVVEVSESADDESQSLWQDGIDILDKYIIEMRFDSLHIHASKFRNQGSLLQQEVWESTGFANGEDQVRLIFKFAMDSDFAYYGYLLGLYKGNDLEVRLYIHNQETRESAETTVAAYDYMENTYERITNAWVLDINDDGHLDVLVRRWQEDIEHEMTIDKEDEFGQLDASYDDSFMYFYSPDDGMYINDFWPIDLFKRLDGLKP